MITKSYKFGNIVIIVVTENVQKCKLHRGSYMSAHVLLNLLNKFGKKIKYEACRAFYLFSQRV